MISSPAQDVMEQGICCAPPAPVGAGSSVPTAKGVQRSAAQRVEDGATSQMPPPNLKSLFSRNRPKTSPIRSAANYPRSSIIYDSRACQYQTHWITIPPAK